MKLKRQEKIEFAANNKYKEITTKTLSDLLSIKFPSRRMSPLLCTIVKI
jgi:hypothetical protein